MTGLILACEFMDEMLRSAWKFFKEGVHEDGSPIDYKKQIVQFLNDLHLSVEKEFAAKLKRLVQLAAKGFNSALEERRNLYINSAGSVKMAREAKLFRGKLENSLKQCRMRMSFVEKEAWILKSS